MWSAIKYLISNWHPEDFPYSQKDIEMTVNSRHLDFHIPWWKWHRTPISITWYLEILKSHRTIRAFQKKQHCCKLKSFIDIQTTTIALSQICTVCRRENFHICVKVYLQWRTTTAIWDSFLNSWSISQSNRK